MAVAFFKKNEVDTMRYTYVRTSAKTLKQPYNTLK